MSSDELWNFPSGHLGNYLRCSDCRNYLSVPPIVVLRDTADYKCGRCVHTGLPAHANRKPKYKTAVRDLPYEELAKDLLFPCKNQHLGCKAREPFRQLALHEKTDCKFTSVTCPILYCEERLSDPENIFKHFGYHYYHVLSTNNSYHTCTYTVPKDLEGLNQKYLYLDLHGGKVTFVISAHKTDRQISFKIRSFCTNRKYDFNIKPINFKTNSESDDDVAGKALVSSLGKANSSVKFEVDAAIEAEEYKFQIQVVGKVKENEEFVKRPVKESETLKCVKCHKFLSAKPVMLTKQGFECGRCVRMSNAKDAVRMRAYEILAKSVLFPCDHANCDQSFNIGDMKKHGDDHKNCV